MAQTKKRTRSRKVTPAGAQIDPQFEADQRELDWWRKSFSTRFPAGDLPPVGAPTIGRRFRLVDEFAAAQAERFAMEAATQPVAPPPLPPGFYIRVGNVDATEGPFFSHLGRGTPHVHVDEPRSNGSSISQKVVITWVVAPYGGPLVVPDDKGRPISAAVIAAPPPAKLVRPLR